MSVGEVKSWASILDEATRRQADMLSRAPGIAGHVALMPDAHLGKGATVGSVIPTYLYTIIPAAVGVDIGCGMIAVRTNKTSSDLPEDLTPLVGLFGRSIPAGVGGEHRPGKGESRRVHAVRTAQWFKDNPLPYAEGLDERRGHRQLGTLGSGNHFVEVCLDTAERVWVVLHSGSRGIGNRIAGMFIRRAQEENTEKLEDRDLAGLRGPSFEQYVEMMEWAQHYAFTNREFMMDAAMADLGTLVAGLREEERTNCHHNFAARETHLGRDVWLTRKGAIQGGQGRRGDHTRVDGCVGPTSPPASAIRSRTCPAPTGPGGSTAGRPPGARSRSSRSTSRWRARRGTAGAPGLCWTSTRTPTSRSTRSWRTRKT